MRFDRIGQTGPVDLYISSQHTDTESGDETESSEGCRLKTPAPPQSRKQPQ